MAVAFRSTTEGSSSSATSVAPAKPAGLADGDIIIAVFNHDGDGTMSAPDGTWTAAHAEIGTVQTVRSWYKVITDAAGEPATYTFSTTITTTMRCVLCAYSGVDTTTPMDATATTSNNASSTVVKAVSITTVTNNAVVVWAGCIDSGTFTCTKPTAVTNRYQATTLYRMTLGDFVQATAGATGDQDGSIGTARVNIGVHIALRPAGAAATSMPPERHRTNTLLRM